MWYFAPYAFAAAGSAAMMLMSPMYWGLYLSMRPVETSTRGSPNTGPEARERR